MNLKKPPRTERVTPAQKTQENPGKKVRDKTERQMIKVGNNRTNLRAFAGSKQQDNLNESGTIDIISDEKTSSSSELNGNLASKEQLNLQDLGEASDGDSTPRIPGLSKVNSL